MSKKNASNDKKPPQFAKFLISICAGKKYRDDIIGDLHEEFLKKSMISLADANRWYWHQVWHSFMPLLSERLNLSGLPKFLWAVFIYAIALLILIFWDKLVSMNLVQWLAVQDSPPSGTVLRILYFSLFSAGAVMAGFFSAWVNAVRGGALKDNLMYCLMPVFLSLTIVLFYDMFNQDSFQLFVFLYVLTRTLILGFSLLTGALIFRFFAKA